MKLVIKQGPGASAEFALDKPVLVIGRSVDADVAIPDERASRRHAEIRLASGQVFIADQGSRNGTLVNGAPVRGTQTLSAGDEIRIGDVVLELREGLARAGASLAPSGGHPPAAASGDGKRLWALAGAGALLVVLALMGGLIALLANGRRAAGDQMATSRSGFAATQTPPSIVVASAAASVQNPGEIIHATLTVRVTSPPPTPRPGAPLPAGTPLPQTAPFTVQWSGGRYEGWAEGRRMSSDLTIENISLSQISPPYQPYFIISDLSGAMRVGELHDYSGPGNPLPVLLAGQRVAWTWFTVTSDQEWVRGSVFRYSGWSWAQAFEPDGSPDGPPRVVSDQQLIPFLPVQIPPEQLATVLPSLAPSFVPTRAP